jgi:peptide subunit release factor 1 (eRF1)
MISLILPPKSQISMAAKMLADEYGTASNIKSRVNRQSVLDAITSTQQRLKLFNNVPTNGLVIYCGTVLTDDNKEKKVTIDFEPFKPINTSLYLCDNKFHTEALQVGARSARTHASRVRPLPVARAAAASPALARTRCRRRQRPLAERSRAAARLAGAARVGR